MPTIRKSWDTFEAMHAAAKEGDPQAQCYLGVCYQNGQGIEQNYQEAVRWFRRAADQNDPVAQCYLGVCYWMGQGVPQEFGEAAKWLREAAEQNDPAAQFNLGTLYETGQGVPQNYGARLSDGAVQPGRFLREWAGGGTEFCRGGPVVSGRRRAGTG